MSLTVDTEQQKAALWEIVDVRQVRGVGAHEDAEEDDHDDLEGDQVEAQH